MWLKSNIIFKEIHNCTCSTLITACLLTVTVSPCVHGTCVTVRAFATAPMWSPSRFGGKGIGGIGRGRRGKELVEEDEIKFLLLRNGLDQWAYRR